MGIQGLLPFVKEATQPVNMRKYSGYAVAVDTYCWLHKGAFACSLQLAKGEPTEVYVRYCLKFVNMLRSMDVRPILVFDGCTLPAKKHVEKSRRERRELYNKKGRQFLREGKVSEARDCFNKCVSVTPLMALNVIKAARSLGVDCIVAPYEADAQLAYLHRMGIVQAVITEDSDLITFGCNRVIVKLDINGNGLEVDSSKLEKAMKIGTKFTPEKFRYMCIIAGCDYLPSLPGIGLGKARKLFQLSICPDISRVLRRMPTTLNLKQSVPAEYIEGFHKANNTFLYQLAFDPKRRKLVPLNPYPEGADPAEMEYAGKYFIDDQQAFQVAIGNMDINTMQKIDDFVPERTKPYDRSTPRHKLSIWHKDYRTGPDLSEENPKEVERHHTKGKEVTLRLKSSKRPREDDIPDQLPTDNDLQSWYGTTPNAKRKAPEPTEAIPETPSPCKVKSSQQIVADRLLERAKSPKRSPARRNMFAKRSPVRRNMFAVKGRKGESEKRLQQLKGDKITSRFFSQVEEVTEQVEEDDLPMDTLSEEDGNSYKPVFKTEMSSDIEETSDDANPIKTKWAWGKAERSTSERLSTLDKLHRFRRSNQESISRFHVKPKEQDTLSEEKRHSHAPILKMETILDDKDISDEIKLVKSEWAWGDAEPSTSTRYSTLDKLQRFQRDTPEALSRSKVKLEDQNEKVSQITEGENQESSYDVKREEKEIIVYMEKETDTKACSSSQQSSKATPKSRGGAFNWNRSSKSKKSSKDKKITSSMSLDRFSFTRPDKSSSSSKMEWNREDGSVDLNGTQARTDQSEDNQFVSQDSNEEISQPCSSSERLAGTQGLNQDSQGDNSQYSYSADVSQSSNLYSLDADAVSYSQFGVSRPNSPSQFSVSRPNSPSQFSVSRPYSPSNSQNTSQNESQDDNFESQDEMEQNYLNEQRQDISELENQRTHKLPSMDDAEDSQEIVDSSKMTTGGFRSLPKLPSIQDLELDSDTQEKSVTENVKSSLDLFYTGKTTKSPFYSLSNTKLKSSVTKRRDTKKKHDVTSSLSSYFTASKCDETADESQEEDCLGDQEEASSSEEGDKTGGAELVIDLTDDGDSDYAPEGKSLRKKEDKVAMPRRSLGSGKLQGACKPSGLSKKRKKSGTSKKTDENASKQTSLFSFLKKPNAKNEADKKPRASDGPMSPVKTNIQDVTPEGDTSISKKDVKKVQRVIFS